MGDVSADVSQAAGPRADFAGINALSSRPAGYAVALKCLEVQRAAERADPSLRTDERVTLHPDAQSWYRGALGEIAVGELLRGLGPEWFIRHAVPIGAGTKDVDHLVIGPGGVFAINTKHHSGATVWVGDRVLRVNNANTPHLAAAHRDGLDVARRLTEKVDFPVPVTSLVALLDAGSVTFARDRQARSIPVVDARKLVAWLTSQSSPLSPTKIDLIKLAAEEPETWHIDPRAADTLRVMQRFERLAASVGTPNSGSVPAAQQTRRQPARRPQEKKAVPRQAGARARLLNIGRLWIVAAAMLGGLLLFRGLADLPCASPTGCVIPTLYLLWKPLLIVIGMFVGGIAVLGTAVGLLRMGRR